MRTRTGAAIISVALAFTILAAGGASARAATGGSKVTPADLVQAHPALVQLHPRALMKQLPAASGYACVVETQRSKKAIAYQPGTAFGQGHSYTINYTLNPYGVIHARIFNNRNWTYQLELCETGSGHVWNGYHQYFDGSAEMVQTSTSHMIGRKWATGVVNGSASASINFSVNAGVVTIGGSTTISSYGTHTGDTGKEPNLPLPSSWNRYDVNRVNAFYQSPANFKWDGTGAEEGNVGQALYEWVTGGTANWSAGISADLWAFCAKYIGSCPSLN